MQIETRMMAENNPNDIEFDPEDEEQRTIFCANLSERVTEEILYELFIQGGPIESVRIPKDKDGRQRTFGFVTFLHSCTVPYALELFSGVRLYNRELILKFKNAKFSPNNIQTPSPISRSRNDINNCTSDDNYSRGRSRYDDNRTKTTRQSDNSALRGSNSNSSSRCDMSSMLPKSSSTKNDAGNMNQVNINDLTRLGTQFLFSQLPGNDDLLKYPSRSNRPHTQNSPYYNKRTQNNSRNDSGRDRSHQRKGHGRRR